ncbi:MAG: DUF1269 domain-containing protein [Anaerolineae bacterium]|nr:DUF1269 domain-containing protein [Anaerolineae bacterium]
MMTKSAVGVYSQVEDAEAAIGKLNSGGFPINQVSIVAHDLESEKQVHGFVTAGDIAKEGASTGAWVGGLFGLLVGAAFVWVPGFGPLLVAGPFAAALLGGIEGVVAGAAGGGLLGALFGWGISKQHILKYEEVVKGGKYLVIANGTEEQVKKAHEILGQTNTDELNLHA